MKKLHRVVIWSVVLLSLVASRGWAQSAPTVSAISPSTVFVGSTGIVLTISGSGFNSNSVARVGSYGALPTTFISSTTITVAVPDALFNSPALIAIIVGNSSTLVSNSVNIIVTVNQPPTITSISPAKAVVGSTVTVTVSGSNLVGATASMAGSGVTVTTSAAPSNTTFTFTLAIAANATPGTQLITVTTPVGSTSQLSSGAECLFEIDPVPPPPDMGAVSNTGPLPASEVFSAGYSSTVLQDGRVLVAGGGKGVEGRNAEIYDPSTNTWSSTGQMGIARQNHVAVSLPDGRVFVVGGLNYGVATSSAEIFDPSSGIWSSAGAAPVTGSITSVQLLPNGHVLVTANNANSASPSTVVFDPFSGNFIVPTAADVPYNVPGLPVTSFTGTIPSGDRLFLTFLLPDGRILLETYLNVICLNCTTEYQTFIFSGQHASFTSIDLGGETSVCQDPAIQQCVHYASADWVLLSDDRLFVPSGIFDPSTGLISSTVIQPGLGPLTAPSASTGGVYVRGGNNLLLASGKVLITNPSTPSVAQLFTPPGLQNRVANVSSLSMSQLESQGWMSVEVDGSNFAASAAVTLGTTRLVTLYAGSSKLFAFVPPALASSANPSSFSVVNLSASYTVTTPGLPPTISGITPNQGTAGTTINATINGSNLSGATSVTFDQTGVSATIQSGGAATQLPITIVIAANATPGLRAVTVVTSAGSFTASDEFTVQAAANAPATTPQRIPTVETGSINVGYIVITPDAGTTLPLATVTYGIVQNGLVQSQAGVLPVPLTLDTSMYVGVVGGIGRDLGVAVTNPGSSASTLTLTLKDPTGAVQASPMSITLQPGQQLARFVDQLFGSAVVGSGFSGSLRVQSSSPFSVLGLLFSGAEFSTLPLADNNHVAGVPVRVLDSGSTGGSSAVVIPQFAMGGGWATQIALVNPTTAVATGRVDVFDSLGNPFATNLNGATQSTFTYSLSAGGTVLLAPRDANGQSPF